MLIPILAGIGALCMSNPPKRKRRKAKRRNPPYRYLAGKTCVSPTSGLTYKVRYDTDAQEWQVAAFSGKIFREGPTYYANDKADALDSLAAFAKGLDLRKNPRRRRTRRK
jgi:hypothetical protein